jgi:hypothetical protein
MNPERIGKQIAKRLLIEQFTEKVSLYPGAFKPPHKGHVATVLKSIDDQTDRVIIFMSTKERDGVSVEEAQQAWDLYKQNNPELEKVEIIQTPVPVKDVYDYAKDNPAHDIRAVFGKGEQERFQSLLDKEKYPHVEVFDAGMEGTYSATELRKAIRDNDLETISEFIPDGINVDDFMSIFQVNEGLYPRYNAKKVQQTRYKASDVWTNDPDVQEKKDPKKGTGKKPKGSSRRLYTDEDPNDTIGIKFSSRQDIVDTFNKVSFKNKSHARQSQIINLVHQRVRAAYNRAKDPLVKARLKKALEYAEQRKEASKSKTQRLKDKKENIDPKAQSKHKGNSAPFGSAYEPVKEGDTIEKYSAKGKATGKLKQGTVRKRLGVPKDKKIPLNLINKELTRLRKMDKDPDKKGAQLGDKNQKYYKALQLAKTLKTTTNQNEDRYLQEARYKKFLNEGWDSSKGKVIGDFVNYVSEYLSVTRPTIKLVNSPEYTQTYHSFGGYMPSEQKIITVVHNRNMADILRTLAHEMVHHMQNLDKRLTPKSGEDGSPDENEANSLAGVIMREFGRNNPHIYE